MSRIFAIRRAIRYVQKALKLEPAGASLKARVSSKALVGSKCSDALEKEFEPASER